MYLNSDDGKYAFDKKIGIAPEIQLNLLQPICEQTFLMGSGVGITSNKNFRTSYM